MSVKKQPNGRYKARYRDAVGKEHARSFARFADADDWERDQRASLRRGEWIDPAGARRVFKEYAEEWRKIQRHRPETVRTCESDLRVHAYPRFGERRLGSIRPSEIKAWLGGLESPSGESLAPATKRRVYAWVASIFRAALQDRLIAVSPCQVRFSKKDEERPPLEPMTTGQVELKASKVRARYRALILLGAGSGLRPGELRGLTVDRVDFLRRELKVDRQLISIVDDLPVFGPPKSAAGFRTVPLAQWVVDELAAHVAKYPAGVEGLLFTTERGRPLSRSTLGGIWNQHDTEPEWATPHDLRHYFASLLIHRGCSVKQVQRVLGHESAAMTLDTYGHWWPDSADDVRDAVQSVRGDTNKEQAM